MLYKWLLYMNGVVCKWVCGHQSSQILKKYAEFFNFLVKPGAPGSKEFFRASMREGKFFVYTTRVSQLFSYLKFNFTKVTSYIFRNPLELSTQFVHRQQRMITLEITVFCPHFCVQEMTLFKFFVFSELLNLLQLCIS